MDYHLSAAEEARSPHHELKPGEWQLWCVGPGCTFKVEKNAAANPICPDCGRRLLIAQGLKPGETRGGAAYSWLGEHPDDRGCCICGKQNCRGHKP